MKAFGGSCRLKGKAGAGVRLPASVPTWRGVARCPPSTQFLEKQATCGCELGAACQPARCLGTPGHDGALRADARPIRRRVRARPAIPRPGWAPGAKVGRHVMAGCPE